MVPRRGSRLPERPSADSIAKITPYVLESIASCLATGASMPGAGSALDRGLDFYRRELFGPDGTPRYMPASTYPIDSQCAAQGIQTFARTSRQRPQLLEDAWKVFRYAEAHLKRRDGAFAFQRRRLWRNTTPHVRWTQSPMMQALTHLLEAARERGGPTA